MKKFALLAAALCLLLTICVSAKSGDIAGKYYSTDIVTTLNGVEIDAINIGGQTLINAEDMYYYSFRVVWNAQKRTLEIYSVKHAENGIPPEVKKSNIPSGTVLGNYYETDIVTYLDYKPITAYNIGGRTYIHAEAMRDFNYQVIWNADERTLSITSPDRWGYVSSISLSRKANPTEDGVGSFSLRYTKDGITATDDADHFNMGVSLGDTYSFSMLFYQDQGPYYISELLKKLNSVAYLGLDVPQCDPSEKYDAASELITISVNGHVAKQVSVFYGAGNGHVDYYIQAHDLPKYYINEIEELYIPVGEVQGEPYEMVIPKKEVKIDEVEEAVLKYPNDFINYKYDCGDYCIVLMRESKQLGAITDRIYVYNRKTGECSADALDQVRALDGFDFEKVSIYSCWIENSTYFRFSLFFEDKTADFSMRIDNAHVELLATSPR